MIFQPRTDIVVQEIPSSTLPSRILSAISLFILHPLQSAHCRPASQDTRIALQKSEQLIDMTVSSLIKALQQNHRPKLIIATANGKSDNPDTVVGAFIPGLLYNGDDGQPCTGTSHFLFQLKPEFRLLRWINPHTPLVDLFNGKTDEDSLSIKAMEAGICGMDAYRIGDPWGSAELRIDPATKSVTLSRIAGVDKTSNMGYEDVCVGSKAPWQVVIQPSKVDVYNGLFKSV